MPLSWGSEVRRKRETKEKSREDKYHTSQCQMSEELRMQDRFPVSISFKMNISHSTESDIRRFSIMLQDRPPVIIPLDRLSHIMYCNIYDRFL